MNSSNFRRSKWLNTVLFLFVCVFLIQGCQPLRKKFVRQKKADDTVNGEVIFEPQDYSPESFTPLEKYTRNYNLWVIWGKSLEETINDGSQNEKRYRYLMEKGLEALNEMRLYLSEPKKTEMDEMIREFSDIYERFSKPYAMWNMVQIRNLVNSNSIRIRTTFNPKDIAQFLTESE